MAKGENAYFISPLKGETEQTESIGALPLEDAKNQESSVAEGKTQRASGLIVLCKTQLVEPKVEEPPKKVEKVESTVSDSSEDREQERRRKYSNLEINI